MSRAATQRALYHAAKRKAAIPAQLAQPALLTNRIQPLRRPVLRLKREDGRRTNEINELGEQR